jgi:hypothetical protein
LQLFPHLVHSLESFLFFNDLLFLFPMSNIFLFLSRYSAYFKLLVCHF